jgi:hypothetical protein
MVVYTATFTVFRITCPKISLQKLSFTYLLSTPNMFCIKYVTKKPIASIKAYMPAHTMDCKNPSLKASFIKITEEKRNVKINNKIEPMFIPR